MSASNPSSADDRPPQPGQLSNLPGLTTHITGHDPATGKSMVQSTRPSNWAPFDNNLMAFSVVYTTSAFPPSLNSDADIVAHDNLLKSNTLGLVNGGGTVCRIVDFSPEYECIMHRTQSLDYGVILEGTIEMILDSGERTLMRRGDTAVQRATMHAWKNVSKTEWARMLFVLQDCEEVTVGGKVLKEDLGTGADGLQPSGNSK